MEIGDVVHLLLLVTVCLCVFDYLSEGDILAMVIAVYVLAFYWALKPS